MRQLFSELLAVEAAPSASGSELGKEDVIELLSEETTEEEKPLDIAPKPEKAAKDEDAEGAEEQEDKEEEEVDELKEIEEELEGPKEEDLELTTPVRRKEILTKYPQLFKDFPYLEKAYYREQQFTELLPTIADAKVAVEKSQAFDNLERTIMSGDLSQVLQAAKADNQETFLKIADNYLPALRKADQQAYYHVLGNVIKDTIITMVREGRNLGEQGAPLQAAANVLNQFVFGSQTFQPPTQLSQQLRPEDAQREQTLRAQEQQRFYQQFESVRDDLQSRADNVLRATIDQHIDPRSTMTNYVKGHATKEAFESLENLISKDTRFRGLLDKLWEKAFEKNFDKESTDRIKSAYLSKAKTLLPTVIKKARNDALRGLGRRVVEESTEEPEDTGRKGPTQPGRSTPPSSGKFKKASDIPRSMSTLDVLMKD